MDNSGPFEANALSPLARRSPSCRARFSGLFHRRRLRPRLQPGLRGESEKKQSAARRSGLSGSSAMWAATQTAGRPRSFQPRSGRGTQPGALAPGWRSAIHLMSREAAQDWSRSIASLDSCAALRLRKETDGEQHTWGQGPRLHSDAASRRIPFCAIVLVPTPRVGTHSSDAPNVN